MIPRQRHHHFALVALTVLSSAASIHANAVGLFNSNSKAFHSLSRMRIGIRGGETSTKRRSSSIPSVPSAVSSASASSSSSAGTGPPRKKKRRKKSAAKPAIPSAQSAKPAAATHKPKVEKSKAPPAAPPQEQQQKSVVEATPEPRAPVEPITPPAASAAPAQTPVQTSAPRRTKINEKKEQNLTQKLHEKMPSLFTRDEEKKYDTYAACLAATESLRRMRDSKLKNKKEFSAVDVEDKSWKSILNPSSEGSPGNSAGEGEPSAEEEYKRACAEYVLNSGKAINALGLSVTQFNQLGREVTKDKLLKEKVMEQAYLYRMASTIKMNKIPLIQDPDSKQLLKSTRRRRVQMFVRSITEIEELRAEQNQRLRKALSIDKIPSDINLCDPNVMPLLSPEVKSVIEAFPLQAEEIVKKYGLNSDEFNQMLEETRGNPVFRWRVQRFKNRQAEESDAANLSAGAGASDGGNDW